MNSIKVKLVYSRFLKLFIRKTKRKQIKKKISTKKTLLVDPG
jgi:hypothetical protein